MHIISGDKIIESETGREVVWRGAGVDYLFAEKESLVGVNEEEYLSRWQTYLPQFQQMGLNTMRLAFAFPDSSVNPETGRTTHSVLDYDKLEQVLTFLDSHGIKAILDLHNYGDMKGDFGSSKWFENWKRLAERFKGDSRIAAYELFNEPGKETWDTAVTDMMGVLKAYAELTDAIHSLDAERIVIWPSKGYLPYAYDLDKFAETVRPFLKSNVVFTVHWWLHKETHFNVWNPKQMSYITTDYLVYGRKKLSVPFWLGEFGSYPPNSITNPEYEWVKESLNRCQEQLLGWNIWMPFANRWDGRYLEFFPLKSYSVRQPWRMPIPNLSNYILESQGVDREVDPWYVRQIELWHNNDYVTFRPGVIIRVIRNHKLPDGSFEVVEDKTVEIKQATSFINIEGTPEYPGDWTLYIYSLDYIPHRLTPLSGPLGIWTFPLVTWIGTLFPYVMLKVQTILQDLKERWKAK